MIRTSQESAQAFSAHDVVFRSHVRSELGSRELAAWQADFAANTSGKPHRMSTEEVFHVLAGEIATEVDGQAALLRAGETIAVPAGSLFRASNLSSRPASAWVVTPVGMTVTMEEDSAFMRPPWAQ
jgi:quercetin dioxygenase-like cupin family protein